MSKDIDQKRREFIGSLVLGSALAGFGPALASELKMKVWKSPMCGCCVDWIKHLEENGITVEYFDEGNSDARERLGMPVKYGSCHTGEIEGYAIEGHVPAREILRLLDEKPQAVGLSVPAMPRGSPGMDGPAYGNVVDPYDVLLINKDGNATVFQSYR